MNQPWQETARYTRGKWTVREFHPRRSDQEEQQQRVAVTARCLRFFRNSRLLVPGEPKI